MGRCCCSMCSRCCRAGASPPCRGHQGSIGCERPAGCWPGRSSHPWRSSALRAGAAVALPSAPAPELCCASLAAPLRRVPRTPCVERPVGPRGLLPVMPLGALTLHGAYTHPRLFRTENVVAPPGPASQPVRWPWAFSLLRRPMWAHSSRTPSSRSLIDLDHRWNKVGEHSGLDAAQARQQPPTGTTAGV